MLTYETLRKIANDEKLSNKLTNLPPNFLKDVSAYLTKKSQVKETKEDAWELDSAIQTLQELFERRERKIVNLALDSTRTGAIPEALTAEEKTFFNGLVNVINEFKSKRKQELQQTKLEILAIKEDIPEFVGSDMKIYGPFKEGDIATLPKDEAKILLEKKAAEKIKE